MGTALQMLLWIGIVSQLLQGVRLVGEGAEFWAGAFRRDYEREVCGRYQALDKNFRSAVALWRKMGCAGEDELPVEEDVEDFLGEWRGRYRDMDLESCDGVRLHRERNADLDEDYPNWAVRYE
jgi:hypothetical protein